jgi:hypothetical protein
MPKGAESKEKTWCVGPYAGVDYNHPLCPLPTHLQWEPYARANLNPMPGSTLARSQGLWIWPLGFDWTYIYDYAEKLLS